MPDWTALNARTAAFRARDVVSDDKSVFEVAMSGLQVRLSDVVAGAPAAARRSLTVYVDTLVIDMPLLAVEGAVICARNIDISQMGAPALALQAPAAGGAIVEIVAQQSTGVFKIQPDGGGAPWTPLLGTSPLQAGFLTIDGKTSTTRVSATASDLADVLSRSWALSSMRASTTAATYLAASPSNADVDLARSMLGWVVASITTFAKAGPLPSDYAELYYQAAGLLVTLTTASGAIFVPVLSAPFYKDQVGQLVTAVAAYEKRIADLEAASNLQAVLAQLAAGLEGSAEDEAAPLRTQLDTIGQNIKALNETLRTLQLQFISQQSDCKARLAIMQAKIKIMQGTQFLIASLKGIVEYYMIGASVALIFVAPGAGAAGAKEAMKSALELGKTAYEQIEKNGRDIAAAAAGGGGDPDLLNKSEAMITAQLQMVAAVQAGQILWASGIADESGTALPPAMSSVSIDPTLAWNSWMAVVEAKMSSVEISGDFSDDAKAAAADYLASLRILAEYGKAIGAKTVALAGQLSQGSLVRAQIKAAMNTAARWRKLQADARNDQERKAIMRSLLQTRADSIKRSVFLAWTYYRASYLYRYFVAPPVTVNVDMDAAALQDAVGQMSQWIGRLLGDSPDGTQVKLPAENVQVTLSFTVVPQGGAGPAGTDWALRFKGDDGLWRLTWAVPLGTQQLKGVLPNGGNVAVWIRDAKFVIAGVKPNSKGNVITKVAVSGAYENGFAPGRVFRFVSKGLVGDYAYNPNDAGQPYIPWHIDPEVYTTPTPFTQWTMVFDSDGGDPADARMLDLHLNVAYANPT